MTKYLLSAFFIFLFVFAAHSQTKKISAISRSGNFSSLTKNSPGGFGETPEMRQESKKMWDSIFRADSIYFQHKADSINAAKRTDSATGAKHKPNETASDSGSTHAGSWLGKTQ